MERDVSFIVPLQFCWSGRSQSLSSLSSLSSDLKSCSFVHGSPGNLWDSLYVTAIKYNTYIKSKSGRRKYTIWISQNAKITLLKIRFSKPQCLVTEKLQHLPKIWTWWIDVRFSQSVSIQTLNTLLIMNGLNCIWSILQSSRLAERLV